MLRYERTVIWISSYHIEFTGKEGGTTVLRLALIRRVVLEKGSFVLQCSTDSLIRLDIPLTTVNNRDVSQSQRDDTTGENVHNIRSLVHQIHLRQNTDRSLTLWIHFSRHLQTI